MQYIVLTPGEITSGTGPGTGKDACAGEGAGFRYRRSMGIYIFLIPYDLQFIKSLLLMASRYANYDSFHSIHSNFLGKT